MSDAEASPAAPSAGDLLDRLFAEFLRGEEGGEDREEELVARAGARGAELRARIRLHREGTGAPDAGGARIGRFRLLGELGQGGLSTVFLAHDPKLERRIALKILNRPGALDRSSRSWILNEAKSLARIRHPGVVQVYEAGEAGGKPYIAMELLPGPPLLDLIAAWSETRGEGGAARAPRDAPIPEQARALAERTSSYRERVRLLQRLAEALAHCHDHGVLHRDIKPHNVLFDADGSPKWIDFGLAHLEAPEEDTSLGLSQNLVGTAGYTAPEQVANQRAGADPRSDQFAFGTLCYECFALANPFLRPTRRATLDAVEAAEPPALSSRAAAVSPDLARVIHHALAPRPEDRYADMRAMARDLGAVLESRPVSVAEPSLAHLARLWARRHRRAVAAGAAALALTLAAVAGTFGAGVLRARTELLDELERWHPAEYEDPGQLDLAFQPLLALTRRAQAFDAGLGARLLAIRLGQRVEERVDEWSRALARLSARDRRRSEEGGTVFQDEGYRRLYWEDQVLCPACPYNREARLRGTVVYPEELGGLEHELTILSPSMDHAGSNRFALPFLPSFRETALLELLVPGTYRLQAWERGADRLAYETVFFVPQVRSGVLRVGATRARAELLERSVALPRSTYEVEAQDPLVVPAYRLMTGPVRAEEFRRFRRDAGAVGTDAGGDAFPGSDGSAPAVVSYDEAMAFAQWAGGRLPTELELLLAEERGEVALDPSALAGGEYLLDYGHGALLLPKWFEYGTRSSILVPSRSVVARMEQEGVIRASGFRLAFSADSPALYLRLATSGSAEK